MTLIKKIFGDKETPKPRSAFAIEHGEYVGEFFVFIEQIKETYYFLSLPKMEVRVVEKKDYLSGITDKIIVFTAQLPHQVFKACLVQYKKVKDEKKSNNRHTEPVVSDLPHHQAG